MVLTLTAGIIQYSSKPSTIVRSNANVLYCGRNIVEPRYARIVLSVDYSTVLYNTIAATYDNIYNTAALCFCAATAMYYVLCATCYAIVLLLRYLLQVLSTVLLKCYYSATISRYY
jgi:hypothetical protein